MCLPREKLSSYTQVSGLQIWPITSMAVLLDPGSTSESLGSFKTDRAQASSQVGLPSKFFNVPGDSNEHPGPRATSLSVLETKMALCDPHPQHILAMVTRCHGHDYVT